MMVAANTPAGAHAPPGDGLQQGQQGQQGHDGMGAPARRSSEIHVRGEWPSIGSPQQQQQQHRPHRSVGSPKSTSPATVVEEAENEEAEHTLDQVSDDFGVLKLIDDDSLQSPACPSPTSSGSVTAGGLTSASTALDSNSPGSLDWATKGSSPIGFGALNNSSSQIQQQQQQQQHQQQEESKAGAGDRKSRRWTVNIPSLSHFADDSNKGLFLPPLNEPGSLSGASPFDSLSTGGNSGGCGDGGNSDGGSCGSPPGFDVETDFFPVGVPPRGSGGPSFHRDQQLKEMHEEEERLKMQLQQIQAKKQQMGQAPPAPPVSPPPSPPLPPPGMPPAGNQPRQMAFDDHLSVRRHSHLDSSSAWGSMMVPPPPPPPPPHGEVGGPLNELPDFASSPYKTPVGQAQQQQQQQPRGGVRRHTVAASMDHQGFSPYAFPSPYQDVQMAAAAHSAAMYGTPHSYYPAYYVNQQAQQQQAQTPQQQVPNQQVPASKQKTGPVGANLFVFNFPRIFSNTDLEKAFAPYGNVLSATVFIDKVTQRSKCFGFVSFDNVESAQLAILEMNGAQLGGKTIKVQLKRENAGNGGGPRGHPLDAAVSA